MASLLYGSGLRLMECIRLRVKDLELSYNQIIVRDGKGNKDRVTMLPESLNEHLKKTFRKSGERLGSSLFIMHIKGSICFN